MAPSETLTRAGAFGEEQAMEMCGVQSNHREEANMRIEGSGEEKEMIPNPDPGQPSLTMFAN